jgi:hypothetical protein
VEIQKNITVSSSPVEEKPSSKKGPSLEKLLSAWKAAETETRKRKEAELAAAHKVRNRILTRTTTVFSSELFSCFGV